jgi:hypothetical protein
MANVSIEKSLFSRAWRHYIAVLNSEWVIALKILGKI